VTFYNDVCYFVDQPLPPSRPVIRSHVGSSVHLEWSPPDGNAQIHGYTIEFREDGKSRILILMSAKQFHKKLYTIVIQIMLDSN
jgi:hypothetical protein